MSRKMTEVGWRTLFSIRPHRITRILRFLNWLNKPILYEEAAAAVKKLGLNNEHINSLKYLYEAVEIKVNETWTSIPKGARKEKLKGKLIRRTPKVDNFFNASTITEKYLLVTNWVLSLKPFFLVLSSAKKLQEKQGWFTSRQVQIEIGHRRLNNIYNIIDQCVPPDPFRPSLSLALGLVELLPGGLQRKGPFKLLKDRHDKVRLYGAFVSMFDYIVNLVKEQEDIDITTYVGEPLPLYFEIPKLRVAVESLCPPYFPGETDIFIEKFLNTCIGAENYYWSEMDLYHTEAIGTGLHTDNKKLIFRLLGRVRNLSPPDVTVPWEPQAFEHWDERCQQG